MIEAFLNKYETMQQRAIYVAFLRFGRLADTARALRVSKQYINNVLNSGDLPLRYASYIGRKHNIPVGLLRYEDYVLLGGESLFGDLLEDLSLLEQQYIQGGKGPALPKTIRSLNDKEIRNK